MFKSSHIAIIFKSCVVKLIRWKFCIVSNSPLPFQKICSDASKHLAGHPIRDGRVGSKGSARVVAGQEQTVAHNAVVQFAQGKSLF